MLNTVQPIIVLLCIKEDIFLIGIHSMQGWTATTRHGVTRKRFAKAKDLSTQEIPLEGTYK